MAEQLETSPGSYSQNRMPDQFSSAISSANKLNLSKGGMMGGPGSGAQTYKKNYEGPNWPFKGFIEFEPTAVNFFQCKCAQDHQKHKKGCPVCEAQISMGQQFKDQYVRKEQYFIGQRFTDQEEKDERRKERTVDKEFQWFVRDLVADPKKDQERLVKGCQVIFTDTVFFTDDEKQSQFIIGTDEEGCMSYDLRIKSGWTIFNIKEHLEKLREKRHHDCEKLGLQKRATQAENRRDKNIDETPKEGRSASNQGRGKGRKAGKKDGGAGGVSGETVRERDKADFDVAIVRFKKKDFEGDRTQIGANPESDMQVAEMQSSAGMSQLADPSKDNKTFNPDKSWWRAGSFGIMSSQQMSKKSGAGDKATKDYWKSVICLQSVLKAKECLGEPIYLQFYAPISEKNDQTAGKEINYNFRDLEDDLSLLENGKIKEYVYKQCLKMCYYLQCVRSKEILQMKVEFHQDENKNIWFTYASDIHYRDRYGRDGRRKTALNDVDPTRLAKKMKEDQEREKAKLLKELDEYDEVNDDQQKVNYVRNKMLDFMTKYYDEMRRELQLNENASQEEDEPKLEAVLKTLRPNTTAQNFKSYLTRSQNFSKSQKWRAISRKVHKIEDQQKIHTNTTAKMLKNTAQSFFTHRPGATTSQKAQLTNMFNAMENRMDQAHPLLIRDADNRRFSEVAKSQELFSGKRMTGKEQVLMGDKNIYGVAQEEKQFGNKQISNLKAELVRNNLVSRSDLMRLYRPHLSKGKVLKDKFIDQKSLFKHPASKPVAERYGERVQSREEARPNAAGIIPSPMSRQVKTAEGVQRMGIYTMSQKTSVTNTNTALINNSNNQLRQSSNFGNTKASSIRQSKEEITKNM